MHINQQTMHINQQTKLVNIYRDRPACEVIDERTTQTRIVRTETGAVVMRVFVNEHVITVPLPGPSSIDAVTKAFADVQPYKI